MSDNIIDPFALARAENSRADDDEVRLLLDQWIELRRAADRAIEAEGQGEAEWDRLLDKADAVQTQIILAKSSAIGLAAKAYLFLHLDFFCATRHEGAAVAPGKLFEGGVNPAGDVAFATAMIRDAVTFLPELAPLAEPVLAAARKAADVAHLLPEAKPLVEWVLDVPLMRLSPGEAEMDELRARSEALVAEYDAPLPEGDAGLIEGERRIHELDPRRQALNDDLRTTRGIEEISNIVFDAMCELDKRIATTPATTLAGAAVKLRRLLHPELGLPAGEQETDIPCLHQILSVIEQEARS
jgi:hypothetical protein